jgi:hypothetical protein
LIKCSFILRIGFNRVKKGICGLVDLGNIVPDYPEKCKDLKNV